MAIRMTISADSPTAARRNALNSFCQFNVVVIPEAVEVVREAPIHLAKVVLELVQTLVQSGTDHRKDKLAGLR